LLSYPLLKVLLLTRVSLWQALIKSSEHLKNNRNKAHGSIYSCTAGVVFLGTPHRGSDKAGLAKLVSNVAKVAFRQPNNNLVHSLDEDSDALERQRDSFTSISKDMPLVCLFEELPTGIGLVSFQFPFLACCLFFGGEQIVPQRSACLDGFLVQTGSIPANHMDMCRFANDSDIGYQRTSGHIITLVEDATPRVEPQPGELAS
jgi:hypothetical protein